VSAADVTEATRELYAAPPEGFITARDALAKRLKDEGRADEAAEVKKLRRPSIVAWAVNVAGREHPEEVAALLEAGQALRRAQRSALSGGGAEGLRTATEERRARVQALSDAAVAVIGERGAAHRDAIAATLEAASVNDELGQRLASGTLDREAWPEAGFGAVEGFELLVGGAAAEEEMPRKDDAAARRERVRAAREAVQRAGAAERAADKARRRAEDLKERAAAAAAAAREAEQEMKHLVDEAKMERKRADRAERAVDG
jgi:hypothetical protein